MVFDFCRKCGEKRSLHGGLCEDCQSEKDVQRLDRMMGTRERKSREEIEQEVAEKKRDKRFWWGTRE